MEPKASSLRCKRYRQLQSRHPVNLPLHLESAIGVQSKMLLTRVLMCHFQSKKGQFCLRLGY